MTTNLPYRTFSHNSWDSLTEWSRDVTQRLNTPWVTGDIADAAITPAKLSQVPAASISRAAAQSIPNGADQQVFFDTVDYVYGDADAPLCVALGTSASEIVIRRNGLYRVTAITGITGTGDLPGMQANTTVFRNGFLIGERLIDARVRSIAGFTYYTSSRDVSFLTGDAVTMGLYQISGGALNTASGDVAARPRLSVSYIGSL